MSPSQTRSVFTRSAMLSAAAREFAECGYAATSLARIMKRLGGQPGHLYYYFNTKNSIAEAIVRQETADWETAIRQRRDAGRVGLESLAEIVVQIGGSLAAESYATHATLTLAIDPGARDSGLVSPVAAWTEHVGRLIDEAVGARQIPSTVDPTEEAVRVVATLLGLYSIRLDVIKTVGSINSLATRLCIATFQAMGCEDAVEIMERAVDAVLGEPLIAEHGSQAMFTPIAALPEH